MGELIDMREWKAQRRSKFMSKAEKIRAALLKFGSWKRKV